MDGLLRGDILDNFFQTSATAYPLKASTFFALKITLVECPVSSLVTVLYAGFGCAELRAYEMAV